MKTYRLFALIALLGLFAAPVALISCKTAPTERVATVRTLQAIGITAQTSMEVAAKLRVGGKITERQWQDIAAFHDNRYIPAYRLAIATAAADLSSPASTDLVILVSQLAALVAELEKH